MRCHHQEIHVIDDRFVGEQLALFIGRTAELAEHVLRVAVATLGHLAAEIVDQEFSPRDAARHLGPRDRHADDADRRLHHIDKGLVDAIRLGAPGDAEKRACGKIER